MGIDVQQTLKYIEEKYYPSADVFCRKDDLLFSWGYEFAVKQYGSPVVSGKMDDVQFEIIYKEKDRKYKVGIFVNTGEYWEKLYRAEYDAKGNLIQ